MSVLLHTKRIDVTTIARQVHSKVGAAQEFKMMLRGGPMCGTLWEIDRRPKSEIALDHKISSVVREARLVKHKPWIVLKLHFTDEFTMVNVSIQGNVLSKIYEVLCLDGDFQYYVLLERESGGSYDERLLLNEPVFRKWQIGSLFSTRGVEFPKEKQGKVPHRNSCFWTFKLFVKRFGPEPALASNFNRKLLKSQVGADFKLICEDGTELPCHKLFLSAQSNVLKTMIEGNWQESQANHLKIEDMTTESVKAFLEFLYTGTTQGLTTASVTLELLKAGHKYNVTSLENTAILQLLYRPDDYFDVETVVELCEFASNFNGELSSDLKKKAAWLMKIKSEQFLKAMKEKIFVKNDTRKVAQDERSKQLLAPYIKAMWAAVGNNLAFPM